MLFKKNQMVALFQYWNNINLEDMCFQYDGATNVTSQLLNEKLNGSIR